MFYTSVHQCARVCVQVLVPQLQLGGGGQGGPLHAGPHTRAPRLPRQGRPVDQADRLLRQTQTHQQPHGR